tara:strand:+ start:444 stop:854 length:411 start_codon:yes stop_codon:yes gene_type:complete
MLTKKVINRIYFVSVFFIALSLVSFIFFKVLNNNLLYFKTPTDIKLEQKTNYKKLYRLGGLVKKNSIKISGQKINFIVTDEKNEIFVSFEGPVPNLFLEGKGVVAEGKLIDKNYFIASKILAKHDENYKPPKEVGN